MSLNIIIWTGIAAGFAVLIFFLNRKNKKLKEKKLLPLFNFAKENNSEISIFDSWDKTLIGIDTLGENKLFFIRKVAENEMKQMINLAEIKSCRLAKTTRTARFNGENVIVTDKIDLVLSCGEKNKPDVVLEFYNTDYDSLNMSGELQLAEKWLEVVKNRVGNSKNSVQNEIKEKSFQPLTRLHSKAGVL